jgi:adenylylsulfate kinase
MIPQAFRQGFAIWLTGLPSSGKTTVAYALGQMLLDRGILVQVLDSDDLRRKFTPHPTYSPRERDCFYDILAFFASFVTDIGINILIAATASRRSYRQAARDRIARFAEVYVECSPKACRARDPKGLWARADRGEITTLPGAGAPYEPPESPEVHVDTVRYSADESALQILRQLDVQAFFANEYPLSSMTKPVTKGQDEGGRVMFENILLATDGSPHAEEALAYARGLALRDDAQVIVVLAFEPVPTHLGEPWQGRVTARHVAAGQEVADDAAQKLQEAGVDVIVEVLEGPPADAILKAADVRECDLIVMGSRGHGTLASLLLGSVSHRVLAHARAPVLIVKATEEKTKQGPSIG